MNNKSKLLIASILVCVTAGATLAVVGMNKGFENLKASKASKTHTVVFTESNSTAGSFDGDNWSYPLSFSASDVIDDADGNKYDVASTDLYNIGSGLYGTYLMCSEGLPTFNTSGYIATFESEGWEFLNVEFRILKRASFDEDKSVISYEVNGEYANEKFAYERDDSDEKYAIYSAMIDCSPHYGKTVSVTEVKLVFSCDR